MKCTAKSLSSLTIEDLQNVAREALEREHAEKGIALVESRLRTIWIGSARWGFALNNQLKEEIEEE